MQLQPLLLLGAFAPLTLTAPSIKFCSTIGVASDCTTEVMDFGVCKWIPDSNAKGDDGSQITVSLYYSNPKPAPLSHPQPRTLTPVARLTC